MKGSERKPINLNFQPIEDKKRDLVECILQYFKFWWRHKGDLELAKARGDENFTKSYGFDMSKLLDMFYKDEKTLEKAVGAIENADAPNSEQIISKMVEWFEQQPEFEECLVRSALQAKKVQSEAPRAWKKYAAQANDYAANILNLGEIGETTVHLGCGTSSTQKGNKFRFGGGLQNNYDDKLSAREFLHEWMHCVEFDQGIDYFSGKAGKLTHFALGMFERYFYFTKLGGEKLDTFIGHWCNDMKYDFIVYMIQKGENQEDVIKFLESHGMSVDIGQINTGDSSLGNFVDFRNKWHGIEIEREKAKMNNKNKGKDSSNI